MLLTVLAQAGLSNVVLLVVAFGLLIFGAEVFTNAVEWFGHQLEISESATGSLLAAVGTALPETMIPVIAILSVLAGTGDQAAADEVGVGAILGAPFMLATIAMFLLGASALYFRTQRVSGSTLVLNPDATKRDLRFFTLGYSLALAAAFVEIRAIQIAIGVFLPLLYLVYVRQTLTAGTMIKGEELDNLHLASILSDEHRPFPPIISRSVPVQNPSMRLIVIQLAIAMGIIIGGAHLFVGEVQVIATSLDVPAAIIALLLAPLATELPEKFNSVIWLAESDDRLAMGNITGAMVFQGTLPATLGILFTSWDIGVDWGTVGFLNALSAVLALVGGGLILFRIWRSNEGRLDPIPLLLGGVLYVIFFGVLVYHVVVLGVTATGGH